MGWWFVKARELEVGDEVRVTAIGGMEFLKVLSVKLEGDETELCLRWESHGPRGNNFTDRLPADERLVVRR